jgi:adenylate cyclase
MSRAHRVLLVDDDPVTLVTTAAQLQPDAYELVKLPGGVEALEYLSQPPVDLVICDVMMSEVDGYAVARAFKSHSEWRYVPLILLTALDSEEAIVTGLEAGGDDFVSKPIEGRVLRARVRSMLRVRDTYRRLHMGGSESAKTRMELISAARLTEREREVLDLLLLGRTHDDIATVLGITERTSRFHQQNLLAKLGAESRMDLIRLFL